jgi:hypothetical protein
MSSCAPLLRMLLRVAPTSLAVNELRQSLYDIQYIRMCVFIHTHTHLN